MWPILVPIHITGLRAGDNGHEYGVVDPKTFQDKVVMSFPMARVDGHIYETACHEGNYSLPMILGGARKAEQDAISAAIAAATPRPGAEP